MARAKTKVLRCPKCRGGKIQHTLDAEDGCWCPNCIMEPPENRCRTWDEEAAEKASMPEVERNVTRARHNAKVTAALAAEKALPRSGTTRAWVYDWIRRHNGATCDEIEIGITKSHQSVSAAVNTLMNDGLIEDAGIQRLTRYGNPAIVWRAVPR